MSRLKARRIEFVAVVAALGLLSCGGSGSSADGAAGTGGAMTGSGGSGATSGAGGTGGGAPGGVCDQAEGPTELAGQWAVKADLAVRIVGAAGSAVLLCPDPQTTTASFFLHVELRGSGANLTQNVRVCDIALPAVTGGVGACPADPSQAIETRITLSNALATHLPTVLVSDVQVTLASAEAGTPYRPSAFSVVLGADLPSPETDPLPFWDAGRPNCGTLAAGAMPADCVVDFARIVDSDSDTFAGVTVGATAVDPTTGNRVIDGDAYAAFRVSPLLDGLVRSSSCIDGNLTADLELSIVDSDVSLMGLPISTPLLLQQVPPFEILPESTFKMLRADGTGDLDFDDDGDSIVSCDEIQNHASAFLR